MINDSTPVHPVPGIKGDNGNEDVHDVVEEAAVVHGAAGLLAEVDVGGDEEGEGAGQLGLQVHQPLRMRRVPALRRGLRLLPQHQLVQEDPGRGRGVANLEKIES